MEQRRASGRRKPTFDSYTLQAGAVTVTQMVSWEGYQDVGAGCLPRTACRRRSCTAGRSSP
ncbi:hypothetical protein M5E87_15775 [Flavonifractor plautii]|nr:hypothetical protein M5E87_15775 [Flavonifractor plautii]